MPVTERPTASAPASPSSSAAPSTATSTAIPPASRTEGNGESPVLVGEPIDLTTLAGTIVFDDYENLFTMRADATGLRRVTQRAGAEFDGAWSPDGRSIAYRDSRRGINEDDEVFVMAADGTGARNLTDDPANDWGPDWSPDGEWIAFNSDRDGIPLSGYLVRPDGSDLRRIETDAWVEYISFSPDGSRIVFEGHADGDYDIWSMDLATGETTQLTDAPGDDGWPAWSPDGTSIAFTTERDDCLWAPRDQDCWRSGDPGEHRSVWMMDADGSRQRRLTPEIGQFLAWSPDGAHLLVSGHTLFVIRPDGTGRAELHPAELALPPGGLPDWGP